MFLVSVLSCPDVLKFEYIIILVIFSIAFCMSKYFCPPGWQSRWFVLDGGVLSYYLSAEDVRLGCRGSVRMASCSLRGEVGQLHPPYALYCL